MLRLCAGLLPGVGAAALAGWLAGPGDQLLPLVVAPTGAVGFGWRGGDECIARAALEGIAYQVADVLHAMESDAGIRLAELRVDGGATQNNFLMQFQADLLGVPVVRPMLITT